MGNPNMQNTITFSLGDEREMEVRRIVLEVYNALKEKGYNPVNQIVGYILSEDAINAIATIAKEKEYCVKEITIENEKDKTFAALFYGDKTNIEAKDVPYLGIPLDEFDK